MTTDKRQAKQRIEKLRELIEKYRYSYHVLDKSLVSNAVNDSLKHELQELEKQYPDLVTPDSPTQRVGGKPLEKFVKVTHERPMLSLTDAFSFEEMGEWEIRNKKIENRKYDYFAELKIDGLAVSLVYENGTFISGATRGDGKIGEDVTNNLKTIEAIPLRLNSKSEIRTTEGKAFNSKQIRNQKSQIPNTMEIRGEVYLPIETFKKLNIKYKKEGKTLLANPRNAAAGSIRQLDPKIATDRKLSFIAWDLLPHLSGEGEMVKTHKQAHQILPELGFKTIKENQYCQNLDEVEEFKQRMEKKREKLPFQIDGIVVQVNSNELKSRLGIVGKAPRGMIAYKFSPEEATTIVEDIHVQVGRTGTLTPVAILKPILVAGSTVSRATLHNEDEIRKKDIRIGDTVVIHKAGDVIPEVEKVIKELRTGKEKEFHFPKTCPQCGGKVLREPGKAAYKCTNKDCYVVRRRQLYHFVSRAAFDMAGLGPKILSKFMDVGLIKDAADLFNLKQGDIEPLERFAEKSAQNIIETINSHKTIELPRLIYALGIPNVGEETAYDLGEVVSSKCKSQNPKCWKETLSKISSEEWQSIRDIGPIVAKSIYDYFQNEHNQDFLERLFQAGVEIKSPSFAKATEGKLHGENYVFTGTLESITRDQAKELVRQNGGGVSESVSKETDYVVVGNEPGLKYDQAKKLGVKIIDEREFLEMVK